ncbi:MAG TPA: TonB-dependent receptor [Chitinophagales bacterium]|nr:TonB-dependent receptor [Chitinophagales bacterium]
MHKPTTQFKFVLVIACWCIAFQLQAQTIITGVVRDSSTNETLIGANVRLVSDPSVGTSTDLDGAFTLSLQTSSGALKISFVGYNEQTISFNGSGTLNVLLSSEHILEEIVVVGYGTQKKSDVTGSISSTRNEDFRDQPISNVAGSIQGKVSGIDIRNASGTPGAGLLVSVRGQYNPLYVVDGIPMISESNSSISTSFDLQGNSVGAGQNISSISDINPDDIESIEILKDASAASIYGARAANGVILITTKRGAAGKTRFSLNYYSGIQQVSRPLDFLSSEEFVDLINEARQNDLNAYEADPSLFGDDYDPALSTNPLPDSWATGVNTNWMDEIFRVAPINNVEFSASGGNDKTKFYISNSYFDQQGIVIESYYKRFNSRINLDHQVSDKLKIGENISLTTSGNRRSLNDNVYTGTVTNAIGASPLMPVYEDDGSYASFEDYQASWLSDNPVLSTKEIIPFTRTNRALASIFADYAFTPKLHFRSTWSADVTFLTDDIYFSPITTDAEAVGGKAMNSAFNNKVWLGENILSYNSELGNNNFLDIIGGFTLQVSNSDYVSISGQGFPAGSGLQDVSSAAIVTGGESFSTGWSLVSFLGRANYTIKSRYLFSLSARVDGSSRFSPNNQFGFFPAGSVGWHMSDEKFWPSGLFITDMKLRMSYGITGDQEIGDFQYISFWSPVGYNGQAGLGPRNLADENLRWQSNKMFNTGLDYELYRGRISGSLEYYIGNKTDLLSDDVISGVTGFGSVTRNYGNIQTSGFELSSNIYVYDRKDFDWTVGVNVSWLHNEIIDLSTDSILLSAYSDLTATHILAEGQAYGSFWGVPYEGVDPETGDPIYTDTNGDGVIDDADAQILGKATPDWFGGLNTSLRYKKWDAQIAATFTLGNDVYNMIRSTYQTGGWSDYGWDEEYYLYQVYANNTHVIDDRWQQAGDVTDIPRASLYFYNFYQNSGQAIESGSHARIREISIGYTIKPSSIKSFESLRIYAQVQNAYVFTKYTGFDPEVSSTGGDHPETAGVDYAAYPQPRTYMVGFNFKF